MAATTMMQTVNISLPRPLTTHLDKIVHSEGYASRSEFFRTLLHFYLQLTSLQTKEKFLLLPFQKRPLKEIKEALTATGRYKPAFIKSIIAGLDKSSIYQNED